ncbi:hypothetical protein GCM10007049_09230 [Echinicola pacifica]|uniref:DUF4403 family protein n=1 Tax=Echinicola pacifica TaxID=346377 RepID=A0A918PQ69_9BACT|nr:DUF4403 family protein [Echinicola pacifica]GGZ19077.1 hypothetical protein GCM10007049_09230 [Echinicola pacifica]
MKNNFLILIILCLVVSCKGINPDKPKYDGAPISLPDAISKVNMPLEIPLSYLEKNLNGQLEQLLFEDTGLNMGNGLFADLKVVRTDDIHLEAVGNNKLLIELPLHLTGELKINKKIFGQTISTGIPFDELLAPRVSFVPEIGRDWDVGISSLNIESWGRSMKFSLLGYELDFGPMLKKEVEKMLVKQLTATNKGRISFKSLMEDTWKAYGKPIKVEQDGIDAYVYTVPHRIKVSEQFTTDQKLKLLIGIEGEVFTQVGSEPNLQPSPLPSLYYNEDERNYLDITLPLSIPYADLDRYLNSMLVGQDFKMDSKTTLSPKGFESQAFGDKALVKVDFVVGRDGKKDIGGNIYLVGKPTYDPLREAIVFEDMDFDLNTKSILANSAGWLKQGAVLEEMKKYAVYPIGEYIRAARLELQQQGYIETDYASFRVVRPNLDVEGIYTTEEDIRLYLHSTGELEVRLKD